MSKWISVKEQSPAKMGKYLVCDDDGDIQLGHFYGVELDDWVCEYLMDDKIIYWMELPEVPCKCQVSLTKIYQ